MQFTAMTAHLEIDYLLNYVFMENYRITVQRLKQNNLTVVVNE